MSSCENIEAILNIKDRCNQIPAILNEIHKVLSIITIRYVINRFFENLFKINHLPYLVKVYLSKIRNNYGEIFKNLFMADVDITFLFLNL